MPCEDTKILEFIQYQKSDNPENSSTSTAKLGEHILAAFSMSTISSFKSIES